jgi:hypothetical protein
LVGVFNDQSDRRAPSFPDVNRAFIGKINRLLRFGVPTSQNAASGDTEARDKYVLFYQEPSQDCWIVAMWRRRPLETLSNR